MDTLPSPVGVPIAGTPSTGPLPRRRTSWTTEETEDAIRLLAGGKTVDEVARRLGRTSNAIAVKLSNLGLRPSRLRRTP